MQVAEACEKVLDLPSRSCSDFTQLWEFVQLDLQSRVRGLSFNKVYVQLGCTTGEKSITLDTVRGAGMGVMPSFGSKFRYCVSTDVSFIRPPGPLTCTAVFCKRKDGGQHWCQASTDMYFQVRKHQPIPKHTHAQMHTHKGKRKRQSENSGTSISEQSLMFTNLPEIKVIQLVQFESRKLKIQTGSIDIVNMMFGKSAEMMSDGVIEGWDTNSGFEQKESHSTGRREGRRQGVSTEMTDIKCNVSISDIFGPRFYSTWPLN